MSTIRHSRFAALPLAKLVASLSQPPRATALRQARVSGGNLQNCAPSAACGGAYTPALFCHWQGRYSGSIWAKAFMVVRYLRNLAVLLNYRSQRSLIFTPNKRPRGTPMQSARAGEARPRGKAGSERRKACFHPGGSGFHLPRGILSGNLPHPSRYSLDTFSRLEEGFYRYALYKKHNRSI